MEFFIFCIFGVFVGVLWKKHWVIILPVANVLYLVKLLFHIHTLPATLHILAGSGAGVQQIPAPAPQGHAPDEAAYARQGYNYHNYRFHARCVLQCTTTHPAGTVVHRDGTMAFDTEH